MPSASGYYKIFPEGGTGLSTVAPYELHEFRDENGFNHLDWEALFGHALEPRGRFVCVCVIELTDALLRKGAGKEGKKEEEEARFCGRQE